MPRARIDRTREQLLSCRLDLAVAAFQVRLRRLALASELRYDSSQPRHPAGTAEGGRWSGGAGTGEASDSSSEPTNPADGPSDRDRRRADISATSTVLTDKEGNVVSNIAGQPVLYPNEMPPSFFIEKGEANRAAMIVYDSNDVEADQVNSNIYGVEPSAWTDLAKFRQWGEWDAQRIRGEFIPEHRDYATISIGLYAAASGLNLRDLLDVQNIYARYKSAFFEEMDDTYTHLPRRNVYNTLLGWKLYFKLKTQR